MNVIYKFGSYENHEKFTDYLGIENWVKECSTIYKSIYEKHNTAVIIDINSGKIHFIGDKKNIETILKEIKEKNINIEKLESKIK